MFFSTDDYSLYYFQSLGFSLKKKANDFVFIIATSFLFFFDFRKAYLEHSKRLWLSVQSAKRRLAAASSWSWRRTTPTSTSSRPETSCTDSAEPSDFRAKFRKPQRTSLNGLSTSTSCPDDRPSPSLRRRSTWRHRRRTTRKLSEKSRTSPEWPTSLSDSHTSLCCPELQSSFQTASTLRRRSKIFHKIKNFFHFVPIINFLRSTIVLL